MEAAPTANIELSFAITAYDRVMPMISGEVKPDGIEANAKAFDMAQQFSVEQGLSAAKQLWDEIFPEEVIYREERSAQSTL